MNILAPLYFLIIFGLLSQGLNLRIARTRTLHRPRPCAERDYSDRPRATSPHLRSRQPLPRQLCSRSAGAARQRLPSRLGGRSRTSVSHPSHRPALPSNTPPRMPVKPAASLPEWVISPPSPVTSWSLALPIRQTWRCWIPSWSSAGDTMLGNLDMGGFRPHQCRRSRHPNLDSTKRRGRAHRCRHHLRHHRNLQ